MPTNEEFYREYERLKDAGNLADAAAELEKALAQDPNYALAYAGLSDAYNQGSFFNMEPPREAMPKAIAAAEQALVAAARGLPDDFDR